ncbi:hypothetical protein [Candidatus Hydrogenosomobacter endosymbioticus]|uniref:Glucose-6-phosphate isomerase n=1 Tax=Candidatus Hydrogenosomobacter endosymbioticus TaxID=2558174 RepID=A0ABM7V9J1_9PROT|nr:hypothetical protein [Candidatus Hydrogenosomobacter endosymbioticus]BDB96438.1 glucose-6-phosphate isomerase [Candidatus Hydrogenosomobacter endosymbioticus]
MFKTGPIIHQDISPCFLYGALSDEQFVIARNTADSAFRAVGRNAENRMLPFLEAPFNEECIEKAESVVSHFRKFESVLVIGTGGSSLGARTMTSLLQSWVMADNAFPKLYFLDNLDAEIFWEIMSIVNPKTTGVIAVSKSGETAETLIQVMRCIEYWSGIIDIGTLSEQFLFITEPKNNFLRKIAAHFGIKCMDHPTNIGGRFSCFSLGSILPPMIIGFDVRKFFHGAASTCNQIFLGRLRAPIDGAALALALYNTKNIRTHVFFPYGDAFSSFTFWCRQLIAESIGKNGVGFTPVYGMGPVDQHSQLQLYMDGPDDKLFTVLFEKQVARERLSPNTWDFLPSLRPFAISAIADLVSAQCNATCQALMKKKRPVRILCVHVLNEQTLGALMMNFIIETLITAEIFHVDPLTQPSVEIGKKIALDALSKR